MTPPAIYITTVPVDTYAIAESISHTQELMNHWMASDSSLRNPGGNGSGNGDAGGFGGANGKGMRGYMYDLKQTPDGQPTGMSPPLYHQILTNFVESNWDESILAPFYKSPKPLYATQILIPNMDAQEGPKAFGLSREVA